MFSFLGVNAEQVNKLVNDHSVYLVGHSMGANVGVLAAPLKPHLYRQLILIEPVFSKLDDAVLWHYIKVALENTNAGISDYWLRSIKDIFLRHRHELQELKSEAACLSRMCEINVAEQVVNLAHTKIVQTAWQKGQPLQIHGWIYGLHDGVINDLNVSRKGLADAYDIYQVEV